MEDWSNVFYYDETSPSFLRWKVKTGRANAGDAAGSINVQGYYRVTYKRRLYFCHRVIWCLFNECIDDNLHVDHMNGDVADNSISNLRLVTNRQNSQNRKKHSTNKSGVVGVFLDTKRPRWVAHWCSIDGKRKSKEFSINKYGYDSAFKLACDFRIKMILELNSEGSDYTNRHGT